MRKVHVYPLSTRVDKDGGPVSPSVRDEPGEGRNSLQRSGCRHVLILVHGFNNSEDKAKSSYNLFYGRLEEQFRLDTLAPDAVAYFHWPGNHYQLGTWDALAFYHIDILRARDSAFRLAQYLLSFENPAALRITLVGHSLGCRLILEALKQLAGSNKAPVVQLISLMAPAVPVAMVARAEAAGAQPGTLNAMVVPPRQVLKFYSWIDEALSVAFPAGQLNAYICGRIEDQPYGEAVGWRGNPDHVGTGFRTWNLHGAYWGDVRTTDALLTALDPRQRKLPPAGEIVNRETAAAEPPGGRALSDRK